MKSNRIAIIAIVVVGLVVALWVAQRPRPSTEVKIVALATYFSHPALDGVQENLKKELAQQGYVEGRNVRYVTRNANSQKSLAANIALDLASQDLDVVVPITTEMAEAVAKVVRRPIVFAAVSDPVKAGLVHSLERPEPNITGTVDAWDYEGQLKLIREITPKVRRLGVIYNPGDTAGTSGAEKIRQLAPTLGFEIIEGAVSSTNDVFPVAQNLVNRTDALFLSSDNTAIAGLAGALKAAIAARKPLFVGDSGTVEKGGLAAVSVGYPGLGTKTGDLVARVLKGEKNLPVVVLHGNEIYVNKKSAELMGVDLPEDVITRATKVYDQIKE